jgi:hypothetical protein
MDAGWAQVRESTSSLLKAMRNDLGVEIAIGDADSGQGSDKESQPKESPGEGESTPEGN